MFHPCLRSVAARLGAGRRLRLWRIATVQSTYRLQFLQKDRTVIERNSLIQGDCIAGMASLEPGSVDLVFADPPFNIGYKYDVYEDRKGADEYLAWTKKWTEQVQRILKPDGTF